MDERSLDEFLDDDSDDDASAGDSNDDAPPGDSDDAPDATSAGDTDESDADDPAIGPPVAAAVVDPAEPTYGWRADGGTCAACGETAQRRWRGEDGLVCPDCKEW